MKIDIQSFFAPRAAALVRRLEVFLTLRDTAVFVLALYATFSEWGSTGVIVFIGVIVAITSIIIVCSLRQVRDTVSIVPTWGEGIFGGVRWGWHPDKPADVLGPYCPTPGHVSLLRPIGTNRNANDQDVIGAGVILTCPENQNERFDFSRLSPQPTSVGVVRQRLTVALQDAGVWKGRQPR